MRGFVKNTIGIVAAAAAIATLPAYTADVYAYSQDEVFAGASTLVRDAMETIWKAYRDLEEMGIPAEDARYLLPNGCTTNITVTMNARELLHFFSLRCCSRAQWEIREMADRMLEICRDVSPVIFKDAGPPCVRGPCPEGKLSCGKPRRPRGCRILIFEPPAMLMHECPGCGEEMIVATDDGRSFCPRCGFSRRPASRMVREDPPERRPEGGAGGSSRGDKMDVMEARRILGDRTYEAGRRLLDKDSVLGIEHHGGSLYIAKVKDSGVKHVTLWDRKGKISAYCDCTPKDLGCRHCAAVLLKYVGYSESGADNIAAIKDRIAELAKISFDFDDYGVDPYTAMYEFDDYLQEKVLDKAVRSISRAIDEFAEGDERMALYRMLWDITDGFESPHDEWTKNSISYIAGVDFYEEERGAGLVSSFYGHGL